MPDEKLGSFFWLSEITRSSTATRRGLANVPDAAALRNIREVLAPGLQRVRNLLGCPVQVTSGYRSPEVNAAVGGSKDSAHVHGLAADFVAPGFGTARSVARYLMMHAPELRYEQLIFEGSWVHIAWAHPGAQPRGEALTAHFMPGAPVTYSRGIA